MGWRSRLSSSLPPFQLLLVGAGVVAALGIHGVQLRPSLALALFVPPLIFQAALTLELRELSGAARVIAALATVGVLLTVLLVGGLTHLAIGLDWGSAFLLGSVVAATDPIATIAVVRRLGAPPRLAAVLEGESLFNDGTGVAAFAAVLGTVLGSSASAADVGARFALLVLLGACVGAAIGLPARVLLRRLRSEILAGALTIACAFGAYQLADAVRGSGVVAVVVAGILVATVDHRTEPFWRALAGILSGVLFFLLGMALPLAKVAGLAGSVLAGFAAMVVSRAPVYGLAAGLSWRWRHLVFWGGLRGALSVALALSLVGREGVDQRVPVIGFGMVVLSLLVQGGTLGPLSMLLLSPEGRRPRSGEPA